VALALIPLCWMVARPAGGGSVAAAE